jgi:hypothetical protein
MGALHCQTRDRVVCLRIATLKSIFCIHFMHTRTTDVSDKASSPLLLRWSSSLLFASILSLSALGFILVFSQLQFERQQVYYDTIPKSVEKAGGQLDTTIL